MTQRNSVTMNDVGFSIFNEVLSRQECELIANRLGNVTNGRAGARNLMSNAAVSSLANDSRLISLATKILGPQAIPFRATLFDKSGNANWHVLWHQDRALPISNCVDSQDWGPWSTKSGVLYALAPASALERIIALRIHLDASTDDNGPLRVIPASHRAGVLSASDILRTTSKTQARSCVVERGGIVAMRPLLLHSSQKAKDNNKPRRVLHIEYINALELGEGIRLRVA
ncbi:MAG TPA: phytanoyl-CoA dioxygenase family protein [Pyrinomonadaceae bacterium]|nr:phytanoyl-CoA dioxygenase family protein [Pyrinomonadaceae bacterium]